MIKEKQCVGAQEVEGEEGRLRGSLKENREYTCMAIALSSSVSTDSLVSNFDPI